MKYYYFAATLPALSPDSPPPITLDEFRTRCAQHLDATDQAALVTLLDSPGTPAGAHPFFRKWQMLDTAFRNAIARTRGAQHQRDPAPYLHTQPGTDLCLEACVADAFHKASPLDRERALDRALWSRLDELAGPVPFDASAILFYAIRLRMLTRWTLLNAFTGREKVLARLSPQ